jgi:preprotein translocase subunit SecE
VATEVVRREQGFFGRLVGGVTGTATRLAAFYQEVIAEMKKVTWPDWPQVRQLAIGVIVLSLFVGALIALMDLLFQGVFVRLLPSLLGG